MIDLAKLDRLHYVAHRADARLNAASRNTPLYAALDRELQEASDEWVQQLLLAWPQLRQEIIDLRGGLERTNIKLRDTTEYLNEHRDGRLAALEKLAVAEQQRDELVLALIKIAKFDGRLSPHRNVAIEALAKVGAGKTAPEGHNDRVEGRDAALSRRVTLERRVRALVTTETGHGQD